MISRWVSPEPGTFKINVDASLFPGESSFSIGMVLRNSDGIFIAGKTLRLQIPDSVFKAEAIGFREALSWLEDQNLQGAKVVIESDSQLTLRAIHKGDVNYLEVGDVIASCCQKLSQLHFTSVNFIRKSANKVAHQLV